MPQRVDKHAQQETSAHQELLQLHWPQVLYAHKDITASKELIYHQNAL
jgi:hypothetical protein